LNEAARFHGRSVARERHGRAGVRAKQRRIAIVIPSGPVARINDSLPRLYQPFFEELLRLGDVEGQNLTIERYSGEGRREGFADLAREVVTWNPDVIVAITNPVAQAVRAANRTIPIVWIGGRPMKPPAQVNLEGI
jgi:putative ABC transport system substrate-binding protein